MRSQLQRRSRLGDVGAIADRVSGVAGVHLLDRTSDRDHNRSVLTFRRRRRRR